MGFTPLEQPQGFTPLGKTSETSPEDSKGEKAAAEKGQVYVKPVLGLSAEQTAALYSWAETAHETMAGIGQFLGVGGKEASESAIEEKRKKEALTKSPEYKKGAIAGEIAGAITDPATLALPLGKVATLGQFMKQSAKVGGVVGGFGVKEEGESRGKSAIGGAAVGAAGGAVLGSLMRAGGKLFGKDWLPWKATSEEKKAVEEVMAKEHAEIPVEDIKSFLDAPKEAHESAKTRVEQLIREGAKKDKVAKEVKKNSLVGHYLDQYRTIGVMSSSESRTASKVEEEAALKSAGEARTTEGGVQPYRTGKPSMQELTKMQGGFASPQVMANIAGTGVGALLDPQDPMTGAVIGLAAAHGGGKIFEKLSSNLLEKTPLKDSPVGEFFSHLAEGTDKAFGQLGTRLSNESPSLGKKALDVERNIKVDTYNGITKTDPFFTSLSKDFTKEQQESLKTAWLNGDRKGLEAAVTSPEAKESFKSLTDTLDSIGKQLKERGLVSGLREGYLPRMVKDREGLLKSLNYEVRSMIEDALHKAKRKNGGSPLSDLEFAEVVNKFMRGGAPKGMGTPGYRKGRIFEEISPEMQKFYHDPIETYHTYVSRAISDIHTSDFFGRSKVVKDGILDVDASIGNFLAKQLADKKITFDQFDTVKSLLETRYKFGNQIANKYVQEYKNWTTGTLLSDIGSSIQNLGDLVLAQFVYGMKPAMSAIVQKLTGKAQLSVADFGLMDHIAEEFVSSTRSKRYVDRAMKLSGWGIFDPLGKEVSLNASLNRAKGWAKTEKGVENLKARYQDAFGSDFPQLVADLQAGKVSDHVKAMAFWDVVKHQPLTKLQRTEFVTKNPNLGGLMFQFKSFMLSQANLMREEIYNQLKRGNIAVGLRNLAAIGTGFAAVGASNKAIQNFLLGKDEEFKGVDLFFNVTKEFGLSKFTLEKAAAGDVKGTIASVVMPPTSLLEHWTKRDPKTGELSVDTEGVLKKMPIIGRELAARTDTARERERKNRIKEMKKRIREQRLGQ